VGRLTAATDEKRAQAETVAKKDGLMRVTPAVQAAHIAHADKLEAWLNDKLRQYDVDAPFRLKRDASHKTRQGYELFLRKKTLTQLASTLEARADQT
jgi:hypothetical protein